jgi:hypothetical protein
MSFWEPLLQHCLLQLSVRKELSFFPISSFQLSSHTNYMVYSTVHFPSATWSSSSVTHCNVIKKYNLYMGMHTSKAVHVLQYTGYNFFNFHGHSYNNYWCLFHTLLVKDKFLTMRINRISDLVHCPLLWRSQWFRNITCIRLLVIEWETYTLWDPLEITGLSHYSCDPVTEVSSL